MAAAEPKRTRARTLRATTQTIDQLERRIVAVRDAENDALTVLVTVLREIAVRLPVDSRLPLILAKRAKSIEEGIRLVGDHHSQATAAGNELYGLIDEIDWPETATA
ncbi:MAG TPA: hypothetical protein VGM91_14350 [Conexibacter sp.]|jgi:hypothetical protein